MFVNGENEYRRALPTRGRGGRFFFMPRTDSDPSASRRICVRLAIRTCATATARWQLFPADNSAQFSLLGVSMRACRASPGKPPTPTAIVPRRWVDRARRPARHSVRHPRLSGHSTCYFHPLMVCFSFASPPPSPLPQAQLSRSSFGVGMNVGIDDLLDGRYLGGAD